MASSPVIAITGGQNDQPRYRHAYQNAEDFNAWASLTKANYAVDTVDRFPDLLRQAFRVATTGTPGPVHLELRGNAGQMLDKETNADRLFEERVMRMVVRHHGMREVEPALRTLAGPVGSDDLNDGGAHRAYLARCLSKNAQTFFQPSSACSTRYIGRS